MDMIAGNPRFRAAAAPAVLLYTMTALAGCSFVGPGSRPVSNDGFESIQNRKIEPLRDRASALIAEWNVRMASQRANLLYMNKSAVEPASVPLARADRDLFFDDPFDGELEYSGTGSLYFSEVFNKNGVLALRSPSFVMVDGDVRGKLTFSSPSTVVVRGDLIGEIRCHARCKICIAGRILGSIDDSAGSAITAADPGEVGSKATIHLRANTSILWLDRGNIDFIDRAIDGPGIVVAHYGDGTSFRPYIGKGGLRVYADE